MKGSIFTLMLAVVLAMSMAAGVVSPVRAAPVPDPPANGGRLVAPHSASNSLGTAKNDGSSTLDSAAAATGERWIEVILSQRLLLAHVGNKVVFQTIVSIGKPSTPTVKGTFRIYTKLRSTRMRGPGYNLPNVPSTMYFYRGYAIHGAYWVKKFGTMVSHGCVNVNLADAAWLFNWASVGTRVVIR